MSTPLADPVESRGQRLLRRLVGFSFLTNFSLAVSNVTLGLAALALPAALRRPPNSRGDLRRDLAHFAPILWPLGFYALWMLVSMVASYDPRESTRGLGELFNLVALPLALFAIRGERQVRRWVDALVAVGALMALLGLAQYLSGYGDLDKRIRGPYSHYMTFAGFLLLCDLLVIADLLINPAARRGRGGRVWTAWRWWALALITAGILGSYTRGAWLALAISLAVIFIFHSPKLLWLAPPVIGLFFLVAPQPLRERALSIADLRDGSNYDRLCMAEAGVAMIAERPIFGQGPEMVERRYDLYRHPTAPRYWVPHLHNSFLHLTAERGLPALAALFAMMWASVRLGIRNGRRAGPTRRSGASPSRAALYHGAVYALFAFNLAGLFENNWGDTEVQRSVLLLLALPFCLSNEPDRAALAPDGESLAERPEHG